jgi:ankyrin repeat protein
LIHALKSHNDDLTTFHAGDVTLLSAHTYLGYTPLHFAAHLGLVSGASILLSHGALINSRDNYNQTPLIIAICLNQSKIVSLLLQHSANIHSVTGINETMALHAAAASGFAHFVSLLLENGAIIDTPSGRGTALQLACRINAFECASILLEKGGNPNDRSALAEPPIVSAVRSRNAELVDLLMKYGTNIDLPYQGKDYAYTALYLAVSLGYQDMARRLLGHGADVNGPGGKDTPCLSRAVALGWLEMTRILIDSGADLDRENKLGMNAIVFAALLGREEIIEILLEKGASAKPPKLCRGKWKTMERYWKGCHCKHVTKETKSRILKKLRAAKHQ